MISGCEYMWVMVDHYFFRRSRGLWRESWSGQLKTLFTHLFWIAECQVHDLLYNTWNTSCRICELDLSSRVCILSHSFSFTWLDNRLAHTWNYTCVWFDVDYSESHRLILVIVGDAQTHWLTLWIEPAWDWSINLVNHEKIIKFNLLRSRLASSSNIAFYN